MVAMAISLKIPGTGQIDYLWLFAEKSCENWSADPEIGWLQEILFKKNFKKKEIQIAIHIAHQANLVGELDNKIWTGVVHSSKTESWTNSQQ